MTEYQISVSLNGKFMFRTEWDDDMSRAVANVRAIETTMTLCEVVVYSRSKGMQTVTSDQFLGCD